MGSSSSCANFKSRYKVVSECKEIQCKLSMSELPLEMNSSTLQQFQHLCNLSQNVKHGHDMETLTELTHADLHKIEKNAREISLLYNRITETSPKTFNGSIKNIETSIEFSNDLDSLSDTILDITSSSSTLHLIVASDKLTDSDQPVEEICKVKNNVSSSSNISDNIVKKTHEEKCKFDISVDNVKEKFSNWNSNVDKYSLSDKTQRVKYIKKTKSDWQKTSKIPLLSLKSMSALGDSKYDKVLDSVSGKIYSKKATVMIEDKSFPTPYGEERKKDIGQRYRAVSVDYKQDTESEYASRDNSFTIDDKIKSLLEDENKIDSLKDELRPSSQNKINIFEDPVKPPSQMSKVKLILNENVLDDENDSEKIYSPVTDLLGPQNTLETEGKSGDIQFCDTTSLPVNDENMIEKVPEKHGINSIPEVIDINEEVNDISQNNEKSQLQIKPFVEETLNDEVKTTDSGRNNVSSPAPNFHGHTFKSTDETYDEQEDALCTPETNDIDSAKMDAINDLHKLTEPDTLKSDTSNHSETHNLPEHFKNQCSLKQDQLKSRSGISCKEIFYVRERSSLMQTLADAKDRRIKAICDRFGCSLVVYAKPPWQSWMRFAILIKAPNSGLLSMCVRSLDSAMKWNMTSQLKG